MFTADYEFSLEVLVEGRSLWEYFYHDQRFVEGLVGRAFTLRIGKSNRQRRALAVISVDGLSVMTGKPMGVSDGGYIFDGPFLEIPGWCLDQKTMAAFLFATPPAPHAAYIKKTAMHGLIDATFWYENPPRATPQPIYNLQTPLLPPPSPECPPAPESVPLAQHGLLSTPLTRGSAHEREYTIADADFNCDPSTMHVLSLHYDAQSTKNDLLSSSRSQSQN
jgi:hypothetical protein